ncbi:unnamed protein product [Prunus armeniaca]
MAPLVSIAAPSLINETCQICLQFGHTSPNCPQRTNFSYQGAPPSPSLTALTTTASGQFSDPNICLTDIGAAHHMTSDLGHLSNIALSTSTNNVTIGNGTGLSIANVGSSYLVSGHQVFNLPEDLKGRILYQGKCSNGLYPLPTRTPPILPSLAAFHGRKVFGCACYPLLRPYTQSKVQPRLNGLPETTSSNNSLASPVPSAREVSSSVDVITSSTECVQDQTP